MVVYSNDIACRKRGRLGLDSVQYSTIIITQQDPILPPFLEKCPTGYKPFLCYALSK